MTVKDPQGSLKFIEVGVEKWKKCWNLIYFAPIYPKQTKNSNMDNIEFQGSLKPKNPKVFANPNTIS